MSAEVLSQVFGTLLDGRKAELYTLKNKAGAMAKVTNYGATLIELWAPDKEGKFANIVTGFDNLQEYLDTKCYFGATIGRYANRIGSGAFKIDGVEYKLTINNKTNTLHGGKMGFDKVLWKGEQTDSQSVTMTYRSPHMEEGFPGNLTAQVTYALTDDNKLEIKFHATTDRKTIVNMTNHAYFNLNGIGVGDILGHELMIEADHYVPVDSDLIPTGTIVEVANTPFDFRKFHQIGERARRAGGGYDINFCFRDTSDPNALKAEVRASGRRLRLYTTQPGLQLFTSQSFHLLGDKSPYYDFSGFTLETQHYPDSINQRDFPSDTILLPDQEYSESLTLDFSP
jgi:aldose 1-epimerase